MQAMRKLCKISYYAIIQLNTFPRPSSLLCPLVYEIDLQCDVI